MVGGDIQWKLREKMSVAGRRNSSIREEKEKEMGGEGSEKERRGKGRVERKEERGEGNTGEQRKRRG